MAKLKKMVLELLVNSDEEAFAENDLSDFLSGTEWCGAHHVLRSVTQTKRQAQERFVIEDETISWLLGPYSEDEDEDDD